MGEGQETIKAAKRCKKTLSFLNVRKERFRHVI